MKIIWKYLSLLKHYKQFLGFSIFSHLLTALLTVISIPMVIPFFQILFQRENLQADYSQSQGVIDHIKSFFSQLIQENDQSTALLYICLILLLVFLLKNLFRYLAMFFMTPVRNGIVRDLRQQLFVKYLSLPLTFYKSKSKGDLLSRISVDIHDIELSILNVMVALFKAPMIIFGSVLFMLYISPQLTLFVLLLLVFTIVVIGGISRPLKRKSYIAQSKLGEIMAKAEESISGIKIVKSYLAESQSSSKFFQLNDAYRQIRNKVLWRRDLSSPLSEFLGVLTVIVLLWYGSIQVFSGALRPETFFAFIFAFYQVIEPSKSLASAYYNVQKGIASAERIEEIMALQNPLAENENIDLTGNFNQQLVIQNVSYTHSGETVPSLQNIDLILKKGERLALVGQSGAGKTTLIELILRFYDCQKGTIFLDSHHINQLNLSSLRSQFGLVTQDPILFHDTISNNISFGDPNPDFEAIQNAAIKAFAHEFIQQKSMKYDSIIGDQGNLLSGGEKQRLALARAIYHNNPILILDEPTSSLDPHSEALIQMAFDEVLPGKTVIIIAHSMKFIQFVDRIIVLKNGKIIESGNHKQLLKLNGEYQNFVQLHSF